MQPHRIETHEDPHDLARAIEMEPAAFMTTDRLAALAQRIRDLADERDDIDCSDELTQAENDRDTAIAKREEADTERDQMQDERDEALADLDRLQNEYDSLAELFDTCTS